MTSDARAVEEDLALCRRELARERVDSEQLREQLSKTTTQRDRAVRQARLMSRHVNSLLLERDRTAEPQTPGRVLRWRRGKATHPPESGGEEMARQIDMLRASDLFDGPWYLRTYPEALKSGLSPARHYLETGADQGLDPGPKFGTTRYRHEHPEVDRDGVNPLVHHLRHAKTR